MVAAVTIESMGVTPPCGALVQKNFVRIGHVDPVGCGYCSKELYSFTQCQLGTVFIGGWHLYNWGAASISVSTQYII